MGLAMTIERRQDQRIDVELAVEFRTADRTLGAHAEDLSIGGMCVVLDDAPASLAVGERFECHFTLPDLAEPLAIAVEVRWVDRVNPRRFGVRFAQGLRASHVWAIERLRRAS
jgi:c-di-GMP-binding flagellar brake protein YcgR